MVPAFSPAVRLGSRSGLGRHQESSSSTDAPAGSGARPADVDGDREQREHQCGSGCADRRLGRWTGAAGDPKGGAGGSHPRRRRRCRPVPGPVPRWDSLRGRPLRLAAPPAALDGSGCLVSNVAGALAELRRDCSGPDNLGHRAVRAGAAPPGPGGRRRTRVGRPDRSSGSCMTATCTTYAAKTGEPFWSTTRRTEP